MGAYNYHVMLYLSDILNQTIYKDNKPFGKIVDMAVFENRPTPPISKIEIKRGKEKLTIAPQAIRFEDKRAILISEDIPFLPYDHKDFYLAEDLLDKQVIDTDGKRLVRVNDVVLETNGELIVTGIDIGFAGILRRLGLKQFALQTTILPWSVIEAFDYQTGTVRIKLKQTSLNTLHPADLANLLEEVGTKERLGIVAALDPRQAAKAIEEADEETQIAILENLGKDKIKEIVNKMHISEIADVISDLHPTRAQEVQTALGDEKIQKVKRLLSFPDDVAGGLMHTTFFHEESQKSIKDVRKDLEQRGGVPETIIVTGENDKFAGVVNAKDLLLANDTQKLIDFLADKKFVYPHTDLVDIIQLFAQYNLRVIPVVDAEKKPIGIVLIDDILSIVEEENNDENL